MPAARCSKPPRWGTKKCKGKLLLEYDIRMGRDLHNNGTPKSPLEVYDMHPDIYHIYKFENFTNNLKNLRKKL
jgi:hypothetical protein